MFHCISPWPFCMAVTEQPYACLWRRQTGWVQWGLLWRKCVSVVTLNAPFCEWHACTPHSWQHYLRLQFGVANTTTSMTSRFLVAWHLWGDHRHSLRQSQALYKGRETEPKRRRSKAGGLWASCLRGRSGGGSLVAQPDSVTGLYPRLFGPIIYSGGTGEHFLARPTKLTVCKGRQPAFFSCTVAAL